MLAVVDDDVCADALPIPALAELDVLVEACELAAIDPSLVEFVDVLLEVEAWSPDPLDAQAAPEGLPAEVDDVVPVFACAVEPPLTA